MEKYVLKILLHKINLPFSQYFLELRSLYGNLKKSSRKQHGYRKHYRNCKSLVKTGSSLIKDVYTGVRKWRPLLWRNWQCTKSRTIYLEIPTRFPSELIKGGSLVLSEKYRDPDVVCVSPVVARKSKHEIAIKPANGNEDSRFLDKLDFVNQADIYRARRIVQYCNQTFVLIFKQQSRAKIVYFFLFSFRALY